MQNIEPKMLSVAIKAVGIELSKYLGKVKYDKTGKTKLSCTACRGENERLYETVDAINGHFYKAMQGLAVVDSVVTSNVYKDVNTRFSRKISIPSYVKAKNRWKFMGNKTRKVGSANHHIEFFNKYFNPYTSNYTIRNRDSNKRRNIKKKVKKQVKFSTNLLIDLISNNDLFGELLENLHNEKLIKKVGDKKIIDKFKRLVIYSESKESLDKEYRQIIDTIIGSKHRKNYKKLYENLLQKIKDKKDKKIVSLELGGKTQPTNTYLSDISSVLNFYVTTVADQLSPYYEHQDTGGFIRLLAYLYYLYGLVLLPINHIYKNIYGDYAVNILTPRIISSLDMLESILGQIINDISYNETPISNVSVLRRINQSLQYLAHDLIKFKRTECSKLLKTALTNGVDRIPVPTATSETGVWNYGFVVNESDVEESIIVNMVARESITFDPYLHNEISSDTLWINPGLHSPFSTITMLCNLSGARMHINAACNRWGGKHPMHATHDKGVSIDSDAAAIWWDKRKIENLNDPNNNEYAGFEKLLLWITTQAYMLVGISNFLFADDEIVEQTGTHLSKYFKFKNPVSLEGAIEKKSHWNHTHFYLYSGEEHYESDGFTFSATPIDSNLPIMQRLYDLAIERNNDKKFWSQMAGLDDVPESVDDIINSSVEHKDDWANWYTGNKNCGKDNECTENSNYISLLPVWHVQK